MGKVIDLQPGQKFGMLTVVKRAESKHKNTYWVCRCDCGTNTLVTASHLTHGHTKSCGCLQRRTAQKTMVSMMKTKGADGHSVRRLSKTWRNMISRCNNPNDKSYPNYGGRGIKISPEWESDYWAFERWAVSSGWEPGLTLDRIDNDKGYCPDNCRWATQKQQNNNKRNVIILEFQGKQRTISQWSDEFCIDRRTLWSRLQKGLSIERSLTKPVTRKRSRIFLEHQGRCQSLEQWAKELNISYSGLHNRYKRGWSVERMLTEPVKK